MLLPFNLGLAINSNCVQFAQTSDAIAEVYFDAGIYFMGAYIQLRNQAQMSMKSFNRICYTILSPNLFT